MKRITLFIILLLAFAGSFTVFSAKPQTPNADDGKQIIMKLMEQAVGGNVKSQVQLGIYCYYGMYTAKNYEQAVKWFRLSAAKGHLDAQFYLGLCYYNGEGVAQDYPEAFRWFAKSADQGHSMALFYYGLCHIYGRGTQCDQQRGFVLIDVAAKKGCQEAIDFLKDKANSTTANPSSSAENGIVYDIVEQMPSFPGGSAAMMKYIDTNLKYVDIEACISGRVIVGFVVEKDGSITNVTVKKSLDPPFDAEAMRVIRSMPKWIPGKQNGRPVACRYSVPVKFMMK